MPLQISFGISASNVLRLLRIAVGAGCDNESESAESKEHRDNRLAPSEDGQEHSIRTDGSEMGEPSASDNGAEDSVS
jgi:hypothetical protein